MSEIKETEIFEVPYFYIGEYLYSYGEISKFFKEVKENRRLFATKCTRCGKVWMPPRKYCSDCYLPTEWVQLSGRGTVVSCTYVCYAADPKSGLVAIADIPHVLALIKLDGADTLLMHVVVAKERSLGTVKTGTRVKVAWTKKREGKVTDFYFVPEEPER